MSVLDALPPWATTGVGSLPYFETNRAVRHVVDAYDVPFCPQLPRLDGDMVTEWLGADPGRCGWSRERDRERPRAWDAFLVAMRRTPPDHGVVKLQVTGPATLALALDPRAAAPQLAATASELATWVAASAREQVAALDALGLQALVCVDEPGLARAAQHVPASAWDPLRGVGAALGLHACCAVPWTLVEAIGPDLLSFDAARAPLQHDDRAALRRLLHAGTRIAWGVLPTHHHLDAARARGHVPDGLDDAGARSLLTASCGTGRLAVGHERRAAALLRHLRRALTASTAPAHMMRASDGGGTPVRIRG